MEGGGGGSAASAGAAGSKILARTASVEIDVCAVQLSLSFRAHRNYLELN